MQLKQFDLNLFVIFDAIYSQNNLTRAGEVLHLAQPTVSNALSRMRSVYGDPLFVRSGKGVVPTPLARRMIGPVRKSLELMQATLHDELGFVPEDSSQTLRVSLNEIAAVSLMPRLLDRLAAQAPGVDVHTHQLSRQEIPAALASGQLDFAIDIPQVRERSLCDQRIGGGDSVCALRRGHPWHRRKLTLSDFLTMQHIVVSSRPKGSSFVELALQKIGERIIPKARMQNYLPAFRTLEKGDYVLVAPRAIADQFDVVIKPLPIEQEKIESWLFWHRNADEDPINKWFRSVLTDLAL